MVAKLFDNVRAGALTVLHRTPPLLYPNVYPSVYRNADALENYIRVCFISFLHVITMCPSRRLDVCRVVHVSLAVIFRLFFFFSFLFLCCARALSLFSHTSLHCHRDRIRSVCPSPSCTSGCAKMLALRERIARVLCDGEKQHFMLE